MTQAEVIKIHANLSSKPNCSQPELLNLVALAVISEIRPMLTEQKHVPGTYRYESGKTRHGKLCVYMRNSALKMASGRNRAYSANLEGSAVIQLENDKYYHVIGRRWVESKDNPNCARCVEIREIDINEVKRLLTRITEEPTEISSRAADEFEGKVKSLIEKRKWTDLAAICMEFQVEEFPFVKSVLLKHFKYQHDVALLRNALNAAIRFSNTKWEKNKVLAFKLVLAGIQC